MVMVNKYIDDGVAMAKKLWGPRYTEKGSWFIASLLLVIWDNDFLQCANRHSGRAQDGPGLLYKWIICWRKALLNRSTMSCQCLVSYMLAFLEGHNIPASYRGGLSVTFQLLLNMAPTVMDDMSVEMRYESACTACGDDSKASEESETAGREDPIQEDGTFKGLCVQPMGEINWDNGALEQVLHGRVCGRTGNTDFSCRGRVHFRQIHVLNGWHQPYGIEFVRGSFPFNMWDNLMKGYLVYFGGADSVAMEVTAAMFENKDGMYITAWIKDHRLKSRKWPREWVCANPWKGRVEVFDEDWHGDVVAVWCSTPVVSCACGEPNDETVRQCQQCEHWIHQSCAEKGEEDQKYDAEKHGTWVLGAQWEGGASQGCLYCKKGGNVQEAGNPAPNGVDNGNEDMDIDEEEDVDVVDRDVVGWDDCNDSDEDMNEESAVKLRRSPRLAKKKRN